MKKLFFALLLISLTLSGFSQSIPKVQTSIQADYLKKSKHQKTTALVLLCGGGTLVLTGVIIPKGELIHENSWQQKDYKNDGIKSVFVQTGTLALLGSIPFFIVSAKNKKKALSLSFKNEAYPQIYKNSFVYNNIPSLTIKFKF